MLLKNIYYVLKILEKKIKNNMTIIYKLRNKIYSIENLLILSIFQFLCLFWFNIGL